MGEGGSLLTQQPIGLAACTCKTGGGEEQRMKLGVGRVGGGVGDDVAPCNWQWTEQLPCCRAEGM